MSSHKFTTSRVLPIDRNGNPTVSRDYKGSLYARGTKRQLPASCIYGFNGTFPGPRINAEYGKPVLVRFENRLDDQPYGDDYDRCDFGDPECGFLTHLHNGHTAPESDGNPHYRMRQADRGGYDPGCRVDNPDLNYPAGGGDREKQSFLRFHDHRMDHAGANVYKPSHVFVGDVFTVNGTAYPKRGSCEVWEIKNGGGGWVHPMHLHMEEHRVVMRNGKPVPDARHPDDVSKEDVVARDPGESVTICREFRTFTGPYVGHCHNLAHEDHAMMFAWETVP